MLNHPWLKSRDEQVAKSFVQGEDGKGNYQRNLQWVKIAQDEVQKFAELFKAIDVSNKGVLSQDELRNGMENMSEDFSLTPEEWKTVFDGMQVDYDGRVCYKEFIMSSSQYTTNLNGKQIQELFN